MLEIIKILRKEYKEKPVVSGNYRDKPFFVLISCILSLRTKDNVTRLASERLFKKVKNCKDVLNLNIKEIERLIYPVGFYKTKAKRIKEICKTLLENYNSKVPSNFDELLKLKGVGRKTANLVIGVSFGKPSICVDTHVHRISNRFGIVKTKNPYETEFALMKKLPKKFWIEWNELLVMHGQNTCKPISPYCSICSIKKFCKRINVTKSR